MDIEKGSSLSDRLESLFQVLTEINAVTKLDGGDEPEARTLAYSLLEIEESCRRYVEHLGKLEVVDDAARQLEEIREELRHIAYHIRDSRFLRVIDPSEER